MAKGDSNLNYNYYGKNCYISNPNTPLYHTESESQFLTGGCGGGGVACRFRIIRNDDVLSNFRKLPCPMSLAFKIPLHVTKALKGPCRHVNFRGPHPPDWVSSLQADTYISNIIFHAG